MSGNILIIEHDAMTRRLLTGILDTGGYPVIEADNGSTAFNALSDRTGLVIIDFDPQPEDALGFLHKMQIRKKKIPVIIMSENPDTDEVRTAMEKAPCHILNKPVPPDMLLQTVKDTIGAPKPKSDTQAEDAPRPTAPKVGEDTPEEHAKREKFMQRAIQLSAEKMQENFGGPFGAVVVRNGIIIGEGWNCVTSSNDPTAHAEISAIRDACEKAGNFMLKDCEIYTSCEPCPMCLAAIYWARIDRIYYANTREEAAEIGFDDEFLYQEIPLPIEKRSMPTIRMDSMANEAYDIFRQWEDKEDKTEY